MKRAMPALLCFIVLTCAIEFLVSMGAINSALIPSPSQVFSAIWLLRQDFLNAFLETLTNTLFGLSLSVTIGALFAVIFSLSKIAKQAILPFAIFFQTVPIIAIAPLLVIYFGFGAPTVIAASFIVSLFPIIANTLMGLESATRDQVDLFKVYRAQPLQILVKLKIPVCYPYFYSGLRTSAGLAIIGSIAGEFVAGGGLGALIDSAKTQQRVDIVFGALLLLSFMGIIFLSTLSLFNYFILKRRPLYGVSYKELQ